MWIIILHTSHYKYKNTSAVSQPSVLKWITTPKDGYVHYYYYVWYIPSILFGSDLFRCIIHHILFLNNSTVFLFCKFIWWRSFLSLSVTEKWYFYFIWCALFFFSSCLVCFFFCSAPFLFYCFCLYYYNVANIMRDSVIYHMVKLGQNIK